TDVPSLPEGHMTLPPGPSGQAGRADSKAAESLTALPLIAREASRAPFEQAGCPPCVALALEDGRGSPQRCSHDPVKDLNRTVEATLHFRQEGNGTPVRWEALPQGYPKYSP